MGRDRMPEPPRKRVLIVDDHPIVRRGLCQVLNGAADLEVVAEAATADDALAAVRETPCDVVVLDLSVPGAVGLSLVKALRACAPRVPVLILSMAPENQFGARAIRAGAAGYVAKRSAPEHLVDAIRRVVAGGLYVSAHVGQALAADVLRPLPRAGVRPPVLSDREVDVLRMLAGGMAGTAIAAALQVSPKTVSTYRRRVLTKLRLDSTASLIRYAIDHHIVDS